MIFSILRPLCNKLLPRYLQKMAQKNPIFLKKLVDDLILNPYLERVKPPYSVTVERVTETIVGEKLVNQFQLKQRRSLL